MRKNSWGKIVSISAVYVLTLTSLFGAGYASIKWKFVRPKTLLQRCIVEQNKELGIRHFGAPNLAFEDVRYIRLSGRYDDVKDQISIDAIIYLNDDLILGHPNAKEILDHELGHFYTDKLSESLGRGSWPNTVWTEPTITTNTACIKLIAEGIAEYFERHINNMPDNFSDANYPSDTAQFWTGWVIYSGGNHLVKPIIDKYGKDGIEYLITHPPTPDDISNKKLPEYRSRVLEALEQKAKKHEVF